MYQCSKCKCIYTGKHKDYECKEELLYKITELLSSLNINKLVIIYNYIKTKVF